MKYVVIVFLFTSVVSFAGPLEDRVHQLEQTVALLQKRLGNVLRVDYPINDQHDNLAINRIEVQADIEANRATVAADRAVLASMEKEFPGGTLSLIDLLRMRRQVEVEALDTSALKEHLAAINTKLTSLEGFQAGDVAKFALYDRETNAAQLRWYEFELRKGQTSERYLGDIAQRIEAMSTGGTSSARDAILAGAEAARARTAVEGWKKKRDAQAIQLKQSEEELRRIGGSES